MRGRALRWTGIGMVAVAAGYAWWAAGLRPFTSPALAAVLGGGLVAMVLGVSLLPTRPPPPAAPRRPEVWAGLAAALGLWELASFLHRPRAAHPTLSSLANDLLQSHPARALGLLVWLTAAVGLARR